MVILLSDPGGDVFFWKKRIDEKVEGFEEIGRMVLIEEEEEEED